VFLAELFVVAIVTGPFAGPKADIAALTATVARTPGSHISGAHVVDDYALVQWSGAHAGQPGIPKPVALELCSGWPTSFGICDLSQ
jgi:hypothetical protein